MQEGGPSPTLGVGWTNSLCGGPEPPSMERMQPPAQWSQKQGALSLGPLQTSAGGGLPARGGGSSSPASYYASFMGRNFFLCCLVSC